MRHPHSDRVAVEPTRTRMTCRTRIATLASSLLLLAPVLAVLGTGTPSAAVSTGPVYVWGSNGNGQAGNGTTGTDTQPVAAELPSGVAATAVSAGTDYSLALTSTGAVYAWGNNGSGELGNGTTTQSTTPVLVQLPVGVTATAIAAGADTAYAVTSTGAMYAWGANNQGQFGNGTTTNSDVPVLVTMPAPVTQIAPGFNDGYALTTSGAVYAWGNNFEGQLGDGTDGSETDQLTPVQVDLPSGVVATEIGAGASFGMAVSSAGTAYYWGYIGGAEAGVGIPTVPAGTEPTPQAISLPEGVLASAVSGGEADAYVLGQNGQVYGWGDNGVGELGNGTTTSSTTPVEALAPSGQTVTSISSGADFMLAVTASGLVLSWGTNEEDQAGANEASLPGSCMCFTAPVIANQLPSTLTVKAVSAGEDHGMALMEQASQTLSFSSTAPTGAVAGATYSPTATATSGLPVTLSIDPSSTTICGISGGVVTFATVGTCTIDANQPGNTDYSAASQVTQSVAVGEPSSTPGVIYTSGWNNSGQLGNGSEADAHSPVQALLGTGLTATQVSAGLEDSAAVVRGCQGDSCTPTGGVYVWGSNESGELGNGTSGSTGSTTPYLVDFPGKTITEVATGNESLVALSSTGSVYTWGDDSSGEIGNGTQSSSGCDCVSTPTQVTLHDDATATQVAEGAFSTYALTSTGQVDAWGQNLQGEAGGGSANGYVLSPVLVPFPSGTVITAISANDLVAMALTSTGAVYMWGNDADITGSASTAPTLVSLPGDVAATAIAAGSQFALAMTAAGQVYAWGDNVQGELGNGSFSSAASPPASPALVQLPSGAVATSIAAGDLYGLALTSTGAVYGWGDNRYGALGLGTTTNVDTPTQMDLPSGVGVGSIGAGQGFHSIVISQLAPQTVTFTSTPPVSGAIGSTYNVLAEASSGLPVSFSIAALSATVCTVSGSTVTFLTQGTCTVDANQSGGGIYGPAPQVSQSMSVGGLSTVPGTVYAFGMNNSGQFGDGTTTSDPSPTQVDVPSGVTFTEVSAGEGTSEFLTTTGAVYTTGNSNVGQLGDGSTAESLFPVKVDLPSGVTATAISAGVETYLALGANGAVYDWGGGGGLLGNGSTLSGSDVPVQVDLPSGVVATAISAGQFADAAVTSTGQVYTWGDGSEGELGNGTMEEDATTPVEVSLPEGVVATGVSMGEQNGLAITAAGTVYSWGDDEAGQLGTGSALTSGCDCLDTPVSVQLPASAHITAISAGAGTGLALASSGAVYGWGLNGEGQIGDGTVSPPSGCSCTASPTLVALPAGSTAIAISEGWESGLAALSNGTTYGWGDNGEGEIGFGDTAEHPSPVEADLPIGAQVSGVSSGFLYGLALVAGQISQTVTITSTPPSASVGGTYAVTAAASSGLPVTLSIDPSTSGECTIAGSTVNFVAGGDCQIDANQAGNSAYAAAPQTTQFVIVNEQSQTISFTTTPPSSPVVGNTYSVAATSSSGLTVSLSVDPSSTHVCSLLAGTVDLIGPGTCTIDANQAGSSTVEAAAQVQQSVLVGQTSQSISFTSTAPSGAVPGNTYTVTATATSGLPVTFSISSFSSGVCTIAGATVEFTGTGTCTVLANQSGSVTYYAAPQVSQAIAVGLDSQTVGITSSPPSSPVVGGTYAVTASASSGLAVTLSIDASTSGNCSISGSTVTFIAAANCTIDANQAGNDDFSAAPEAQQTVSNVGQGSQTITFTSSPPGNPGIGGTYVVSAASSSGLPVTLSIDASSSSVCSISGSTPGSTVTFNAGGTCQIDANQGGNTNYLQAPQVTQSVSVTDVASSCTIEWTGGTGDWTTVADWTPKTGSPRLPDSSDTTCIPANSTVTLSSADPSENAGTLLLGNVNGTGTGSLTVDGTLTLEGGTTYPGGVLAVPGGGTVNQSGTFSNGGSISTTSTGTFDENGTFTNAAGGTIANSGTFEVGGGEHFTENGGTTSGSPVLINDAFLNFTGGGTSSFSVIADGTTDVSGAPYAGQSLTLQTSAAAGITPGSTPNLGTIEFSPGSNLSLTGTLTNAGTIQSDAGSGTSGISGGTVNSSGAIVDNGTFAISSTTWTNSGPLTVSSTGTFDENGTFTNAAGGTIANSGTFEVGGGEHFTENGGTTSGSPILINDAFLNFTGGGTSSFSVIADGTSNVSGAPYAGQSLTLQTSAAAGITPGSTPNLGTIELEPASTLSLTGTLTNAGTIQSDAGSGTSGISGGTVNSSGAIVDNGTFAISSTTWTNSGPLTVSSTGTFDENGTFTNAAGGTIANSGTFEVGGGEHFTENGGTTSGSPILINDAFLNFTGGGTSSFSVIADGTTDVSGAPYAGQSLTLQTSAAAAITPGSTPNLGTIELYPHPTCP